MENKEAHVRFCCCSKPFRDKLVELGFKEMHSDPESYGMKQVRKFYKDNLYVEDSYAGLYLYATEDKPGIKGVVTPTKTLKYHGLSVNKELLENFSRKGIYNK